MPRIQFISILVLQLRISSLSILNLFFFVRRVFVIEISYKDVQDKPLENGVYLIISLNLKIQKKDKIQFK